ncbi:hypothetical protein DSO57_1018790 [Entomophthora muscae]|uniref:Uncharacterized protein n=1 Tax=Entomophthora muscae TaxID=34485 RepID=A0ACC2T4C0_9FUNG|nr:hypothetical protein DSO57_1018790 [Entomophthora muscae]
MSESVCLIPDDSSTLHSKLDILHSLKSSPRAKRKENTFYNLNSKAPPPPFFNPNRSNRGFRKKTSEERRELARRSKSQVHIDDFRQFGHQTDLKFDVRDMWSRGLTHAVEIREPILEKKLLMALERVEHLENEVEYLKKKNHSLTLQNLKLSSNDEEKGNPSFYHEYWFMCRQYTELQKRYFARAITIKESCKDVGVQCDRPIPISYQQPPLPQIQAPMPPSISQASLSSLPPKVNLNQIKNIHQRRNPQRHPTEHGQRNRETNTSSPAKTLGSLSNKSNLSDEKLMQGKVMDLSSKKWLASFKEFHKVILV